MTVTITALQCAPDEGQGLTRDMCVRWALEEVARSYNVRLMSFAALKEPEHRARNTFGLIPTYEERDLVLFESGAIVFHIVQNNEGLLPNAYDARARAISWMVAALQTVEPPIVEYDMALWMEREKHWFKDRLALLADRVHIRLRDLSTHLGDADWLDGAFSAGDLLMVSALRRAAGAGILERLPNLVAYVSRGETRPAFQRALAAQRAVFAAQPSPTN